MALNVSLHFPSKGHSFVKIFPGKRLAMHTSNISLKWFFGCDASNFHTPLHMASVISGHVLFSSLPTCILNNKDFWLDLMPGSSSECSCVFFHHLIEMGEAEVRKARFEMKGKLRSFDSNSVAPSLSLAQKLYPSHTSYCKSLWYDVTMQQTHKDVSHIALQTQTPSLGNRRETLGLPLPSICLKDQEEQFHFQQNEKGNHEKSQPPFFLLIYCCIQGSGNSERHWYWVPRGPYKGHSQPSNELALSPLAQGAHNGTGSYSGSGLLCRKWRTLSSRNQAVLPPGLLQGGQFFALKLWRFGARRFERPWALFLPASTGL